MLALQHREQSTEGKVPPEQKNTGDTVDAGHRMHPGLKDALSDFFSSSFMGIAVANLNRIVDANDAFLQMVGYRKDDLISGKLDWREMTPQEYQHFDNDSLKQLLAKGECVPFEKEFFHRDGTRVPVLVGKKLLSREPLTWASFIMDLSARREAEHGLKIAREKAELYVDLMGHDINNLNQIALGYLELAGETMSLDCEGRMFMDKSVETLKRSAQLIDNVKKLQRVGNVTGHDTMVDLAATIHSVTGKYSSPGKVDVLTNVRDEDHFYVMADDMLQDVFTNLVDNAIKHSLSEKPQVTVNIKKLGTVGRSYYKVDVEDDGPGVADEIKDIIFNRHLRSSKNAKGSGIGLFLVKTLVRSYRGHIWVEDREPGYRSKGARFVVMLPAAVPEETGKEEQSRKTREGLEH